MIKLFPLLPMINNTNSNNNLGTIIKKMYILFITEQILSHPAVVLHEDLKEGELTCMKRLICKYF